MRCPRCATDNPDGFRFCGACGGRLPMDEAAETGVERKMVSAVFCDLVGFTARAERLDPEDVHRLLHAYYATVRCEFERFGGTVAKYIGDAVFVLFGAPRAHEDDPERAVRAALAGLEALNTLNAADDTLDLHVHIGVTTGETLVTFGPESDEHESLAWGDVLNTAARLESAAPPDEIRVDAPTYRATRHVVEYQEAEPVVAKGKAEPVPVWRPLHAVTRRAAGRAAVQGPSRPFVNRRVELGALQDALDAVCDRRMPHLVSVVGDPGIGKSRLVAELLRRVKVAPQPIASHHGRSPPYLEGGAFWALGEIIKDRVGMLATDGAALAMHKLRRTVRDIVPAAADAARIESQLRSLVGLGDGAQVHGDHRGAAFAAWRNFLEAMAQQRPLVLVFDDIQWADAGLLDFIEHLADWSRDVPLFIVCTTRRDLLRRCLEWGTKANATTLELPPLTDDETRELVGSLAAIAIPDKTTEAVVAHAEGNPLYAVEFVRMLDDRLHVAGDGSGDPSTAKVLPVPESLRGIIASRLDSLAVDDKRLLQAASVMGRAVWPGALAAIVRRPPGWVADRLRSLEERQFLTRRRGSTVEHELEYGFQHALIGDVAYGEISRRRRAEIHRRTAEWLESLSPDRAVDRTEMLALHYRRAYELEGATGGLTTELVDRTRRALRDAGDRVLTLHAFAAAARYYRAALELWPDDDPERPWLLLRLGTSTCHGEMGGVETLTEARDALLAAGHRGSAAEAEARLAYLAHHLGLPHEVDEHLNHAVLLVDGLEPTRAKGEVLVDLANYLSMACDHERTVSTATEALEIAQQLGLPDLRASALSVIGSSRVLSGDLEGRKDLQRSISLTEETGSHLSVLSLGMLADLEGQLGNLGECFALQARARKRADELGHAGYVRWLAAEGVGERYWTGAWDEALGVADSLIAESDPGTPSFVEGYCHAVRGRIRLARGDADGALADAVRTVDLGRAANTPQTLYPALAFGASAQVVAGSPHIGANLADELLGLWTSRPDVYPASSWAVDLGYALLPLGRRHELAQMERRVRASTPWLEAVISLAAGEFEVAAGHFRRIGSLPDAALACLRAATALGSAGREQGARRALDSALVFLRRVDARLYLLEAAALAPASIASEGLHP